MEEEKSTLDIVKEDLDTAAEATTEAAEAAEAKAAGAPQKRPLSHKLYDRMGLNMSLKAINGFILVVVVLLAIALVIGVLK